MLRIAVDVGGTFTDVVAVDDAAGETYVLKVCSTPRAPERGFLEGVARMLAATGKSGGDVGMMIHVGTIGTNLFMGQVGIELPKTALITTRGFRDVLEIGRQNRPQLYDLFFRRPRPLVERRYRFEVSERTDARGRVLERPGEEEIERIAEDIKRIGFDSVAISFLNSYANPENEALVKDKLEEMTGIAVHASHLVDPEHREYERTSTTVVNAILAPVVSRYIASVMRGLGDLGIEAPFYIMSSAGGVVDVEEARRRPITSIESGPAAGVVGAAFYSSLLGLERVISLDMGGTTAKAGAIISYEPLIVPEIEVGGVVHMGRYIKGSGYPVRYPSIDLAEVSAGGGTIIWVDEAGTIRAGPISAGADPGPACYGKGGDSPTITDANLILGRLGEAMLGGEMRLRRDLAEEAFRRIARSAGMGVEEAAYLALRVANLHMARAVKIVSLERGHDPRGFTLMAFGGAGPMHAAELAELLEMRRVVIPPHPEVFSALSLLLTDMRYDYVSGMIRRLDLLRPEELEEAFARLEEDALGQLARRGYDVSRAVITRSIDMRYYGQGYELEVQAPRPIGEEKLDLLAKRFEEKHRSVYGFTHSGEKIEVVALRIRIVMSIQKPRLRTEPLEG